MAATEISTKRHLRYLKNQTEEQKKALIRYYDKKDEINAKKRKKYHENIELSREKVKNQVAAFRAKKKVSQSDTGTEELAETVRQNDTD